MKQKPALLYLGTDPVKYESDATVTHCKMIEIVPRKFDNFEIKHQIADILEYTHIIFTSKNAVNIFMDALHFYGYSKRCLQGKEYLVIGSSTASALKKIGISHMHLAKKETQEGVMDLLDLLDLENAYIFYPRSSRARPTLSYYLRVRQLRHQICDLYDTKAASLSELPVLNEFDEVVFTSPSTVEAFFESFSVIPPSLKLTAIGPITEESLNFYKN